MDVLVWTAVIGSAMPVITFAYLIVFGQKSLADWYRDRRALDLQPQSVRTQRAAETRRAAPSRKTKSTAQTKVMAPVDFRKLWLSATGRLIIYCWQEGGEEYADSFFLWVTGAALRVLLFLTGALLIFGPLLWVCGLVFNGHGAAQFGMFATLGGLLCIAAELYIMVLVSLVALFLLLMTDKL